MQQPKMYYQPQIQPTINNIHEHVSDRDQEQITQEQIQKLLVQQHNYFETEINKVKEQLSININSHQINNKIIELENIVNKKNEDLLILASKIKENEIEIKNKDENIFEYYTNIQELKKQLIEYENYNNKLVNKVKECANKINEYDKQEYKINEYEKQVYKINEYEKQINEYEKQINENEKQINENKKLVNKVNEYENKVKQFEEYKNNNVIIIEDITQMKNNHINILNNKIIELNNDIVLLKNEMEEFENKKNEEFEKNFNNKLYYELLIKEKFIVTEIDILKEKYKEMEVLLQ